MNEDALSMQKSWGTFGQVRSGLLVYSTPIKLAGHMPLKPERKKNEGKDWNELKERESGEPTGQDDRQ
jgi:hypothetical protein